MSEPTKHSWTVLASDSLKVVRYACKKCGCVKLVKPRTDGPPVSQYTFRGQLSRSAPPCQ